MTTVHDYSIGVLASHNVIGFLTILLDSLKKLNVDPSQIYVGDAGLLDNEIDELVDIRGVHIIDLPMKNKGTFKTQSEPYKIVIGNRINFLKNIQRLDIKGAILQLDADTAVVKEEFEDVDPKAQLILTVREDSDYIKKFAKHKNAYPNLGVTFWKTGPRAKALWEKWARIRKNVPDNTGQYEQNSFLHVMNEDEYFFMRVQKLPCEKYNCYKPEWLVNDPCIIHFKGREGRDRSKRGPNPILLKYVLGETDEETQDTPTTGCPEVGMGDQE